VPEAPAASPRTINPEPPTSPPLSSPSAYAGNNVYNTTGTNQVAKAKTRRTEKAVFYLKLQNDGTLTDTFRLNGPGKKPGVAVTYLAGSTGRSSPRSR
jgi:hypothetical protein